MYGIGELQRDSEKFLSFPTMVAMVVMMEIPVVETQYAQAQGYGGCNNSNDPYCGGGSGPN